MGTTTLLDRAVCATVAGSGKVLVIGSGDDRYHDEGVGRAVVERLRDVDVYLVGEYDASQLREMWRRADLAIVVVAARNDLAHPGRVHTLVTDLPRGGAVPGAELVGQLSGTPRRVVVYAVEGGSFRPGRGLSRDVDKAVDRLVGEIVGQLRAEGYGTGMPRPLANGRSAANVMTVTRGDTPP